MKNPASFIRQSLVTLLDGAITYEGSPVPCYEGEGEIEPYQILLADASGNERDDRHSFNTEYEQLIEVVSRQQTNLRKHVDSIGGSVMNLIKPTPMTHGISDSADFQILMIRRASQNYLSEQESDGTNINRLLLRIRFLIVEK